jgi:hypothetical protein
MILKPYIPRPLRVQPHKILVPRGPLVLRVARQHALQAHAYALDVLHGRPAGRAEEVETDDAVAVDVGVDGDFADEGGGVWGRGGGGGEVGGGRGGGDVQEDDFGGFWWWGWGLACWGGGRDGWGRRTDGVVVAEAEAEAVGLVEVEGVGVEDLDVHLPLFEVVG